MKMTKMQEHEQQEQERAYEEAISLAIRQAVVNAPELGAYTTPAVIEQNQMAMLAWGVAHLPNGGQPTEPDFWEVAFRATKHLLKADLSHRSIENRREMFNAFVERLPASVSKAVYLGNVSGLDDDQQETLQYIGGAAQFKHFMDEGDFNA